MAATVLPALFAVFLWWFLTGAILYLDGLPRRTFKWTLLASFGVLAAAFWGLYATSGDTSLGGAYASFGCGVLIWGWQQISFYTGAITGPRKVSCAKGCSGWPHFVHALQVCLYHEAMILVSAGLCLLLTWGAPNQIGLWTFLILWLMHESARLNVFLGVRNVTEEFLPAHMEFLKSFLRQRPMNLLFPFSVTAVTLLTMWMAQKAYGAETAIDTAGYVFLTTLLALALIEHWFLVLPLPAEKLWSWGLTSRADGAEEGADDARKPVLRAGSAFLRRDDTMTRQHLQPKNEKRVSVCGA